MSTITLVESSASCATPRSGRPRRHRHSSAAVFRAIGRRSEAHGREQEHGRPHCRSTVPGAGWAKVDRCPAPSASSRTSTSTRSPRSSSSSIWSSSSQSLRSRSCSRTTRLGAASSVGCSCRGALVGVERVRLADERDRRRRGWRPAGDARRDRGDVRHRPGGAGCLRRRRRAVRCRVRPRPPASSRPLGDRRPRRARPPRRASPVRADSDPRYLPARDRRRLRRARAALRSGSSRWRSTTSARP